MLLASILVVCSCTPRRDFCDCMNISKAVTDGFILSEKELEEKEKGCEWIQKEMSQMELLEKMSSCYQASPNKNTKEKIDDVKPIENQNISPESNLPNPTDTLVIDKALRNDNQENPNTIENSGLEFMYSNIGNFTKSADVLKNLNFETRIRNLLGNRFDDFKKIYNNSPTLEIIVPYKNQPTEILLIYLDPNDGEKNNALLIVDPKKNLINVDITLNNKTELFYENSIKSSFFINKYE